MAHDYSTEALVQIVKTVTQTVVNQIAKNNRKFVIPTLKNWTVTGDQLAQNTIDSTHIKQAAIDIAKIKEFSANVAQIAVAEIESAVIDTAQITNLAAYVADITIATITQADIAWADIDALTATVADITSATIGTARINYAQIDGATIGTALITQGVGGKLYINELAVTEANMVSLTVGELVVKGTDGKFYSVSVNGQGNVITTEKQVTGTNIANNTISGSKIIENTITARELNVASIYADSALINAIKAANIDVSSLFASTTYTDALRTNLISSNIGGLLKIEGDNGVLISVKDTISGINSSLSSHASSISSLATSVSSKTTIFYQTSQPTPISVGDVWYDTDANPVTISRWSGTSWVDITSIALAQALSAASTAQSTADGKIRTFAQTSAPTGMVSGDVGDLWVDTDDNNKLYRYSGTQWVAVQDTHNDATLASHTSTLSSLSTSVNSKTTIFYQTSQPTANVTGDIWYDTDAVPVKIYRWSGSAWTDITTVALNSALTAAATAQSTADGKIMTYSQTTAPTGMTASDVGDLWIDTDDNNKLYRYSGSSWVAVQDTHNDATLASHTSTLSSLSTSLSGKTTIFYQASQPTATATGDVWYDTDASPVTIFRWNGTTWADITTTALSQALAAAGTAQATADGKVVTFAQSSTPTATAEGDLWLDTSDGNKMYRWDGGTWVEVRDASFVDLDAQINIVRGMISAKADRTTVDDLAKTVTDNYTEVTQTADGLSVLIGSNTSSISGLQSNVDDLNDFKEDQAKLISLKSDGVHVSNPGYKSEAILKETGLYLTDNNGFECAYFADTKSYIENAQVLNTLQIGGVQFVKYTPSGRVALKWVG